MRQRTLLIAAVAVAVGFVIVALPGLSRYGPTWDLAVGEYGYGHQFLSFALTGDEGYPEHLLPGRTPAGREPHPDFAASRFPLHAVYPLGGMLSAATCELLWRRWGWLPAMEAHHLAVLLCFAALLGLLVVVAGGRLGGWAAAGAALAALGHPRLLAHGFHNLKDVPETLLYTSAYLAAAKALLSGRSRWWIFTGLLLGLALAQKANALFLPVQVLVLLSVINVVRRRAGKAPCPWPWAGIGLVAVTLPLAYMAVSPQLWTDTAARLSNHIAFILDIGTTDPTGAGDRLAGLRTALHTTPLPLLMLAVVGAFSKRMDAETRALLLVGLSVPLLRTLLPIRYHDGIRHYLEFVPFACLLAGAGLAAVVEGLHSRLRRPGQAAVASVLVTLAVFAPGAWAVATTFPHGVTYFNALAGGLAGAQADGRLGATDYWANSYWDGLAWLDEHAEPDTALLVPVARWVVAAAAPVRLRPDLILIDSDDPVPSPPVYAMAITRLTPRQMPLHQWLRRDHEPVHTIEVQDAPILEIFRLDNEADIQTAMALWTGWPPLSRRLQPWFRATHPELATDAHALVDAVSPDVLEWLRAELEREPTTGSDELLGELRRLQRLTRRP